MSALIQPLPEPPLSGFRYYRTPKEVRVAPELLAYQHLLLRAWEEMQLSGMLTLNGTPTVYVSDRKKPISSAQAAELQCQFWNQGLATVLLLREPGRLRVFSSMVAPVSQTNATEENVDARMVEKIDLATQAAWAERFYIELGTGQYYAKHSPKFDPKESVDAWLIDNLEAIRNVLTSGPEKLKPATAHAFLGRILFTCYLCHRGIINLENYVGGGPWEDLRDLLKNAPSDKILRLLYTKLFPKLRESFNGSMFDEDLTAEKAAIRPSHLDAVLHFLEGSEVKHGQRSLGFWAYRFDFIPVETISSIYEKFLEHEDGASKRKLGAYYTPRLLAEMTLDLALRDQKNIRGLRFIDPSCGSGIFLVLAFNRLAAAWNRGRKREPSVNDRANALLAILGQLCGVDMNLTACRIACFSLYLAFLDQFSPSDIEEYVEATGHKLPNLLLAEECGLKAAKIPVIWKRDFLANAEQWRGQFDVVIGNPPWEGRGEGQIANRFMEAVPGLLAPGGRSALILPSKIFLNKTDTFQRRWLKQVTLETMIQLADYSFILFKEAMCPACIVGFTVGTPPRDHEIEYIAPKVNRVDLRDGLISVAPQDRKWIRLSDLLDDERGDPMSVVWKTHLWGTPRDQKLLDYLFTLPRLSELVGTPTQMEKGTKRWAKGQGFQPLPASKEANRDAHFLAEARVTTPKIVGDLYYLPIELTQELNAYLKDKGYRIDRFHRSRDERIFQAPMVLLNQGFTKATFVDYAVRFQHSMQSFVAPEADSDGLKLLALCFKSKLFRYFVFHTSSNIGTERDKVHLDEVLRLPFFLPEHHFNPESGKRILKKIVSLANQHLEKCKKKSEKSATLKKMPNAGLGPLFGEEEEPLVKQWVSELEAESCELRLRVDPLLYEYFGLTDQDIALVEDTCEIFDQGDTPPSLEKARDIPTLSPVNEAEGLEPYATMLATTLNQWASGPMKVSASGTVDIKSGVALVELTQTKEAKPFRTISRSSKVLESARRLQEASLEKSGSNLGFQHNGWFFDEKRILIVKVARLGEWTRTAALNDAAELFGHISESRSSRQI